MLRLQSMFTIRFTFGCFSLHFRLLVVHHLSTSVTFVTIRSGCVQNGTSEIFVLVYTGQLSRGVVTHEARRCSSSANGEHIDRGLAGRHSLTKKPRNAHVPLTVGWVLLVNRMPWISHVLYPLCSCQFSFMPYMHGKYFVVVGTFFGHGCGAVVGEHWVAALKALTLQLW